MATRAQIAAARRNIKKAQAARRARARGAGRAGGRAARVPRGRRAAQLLGF